MKTNTTKQAPYTDGPWHTERGQEIMSFDGRLIAQCHAGYRPEREANARLIAMAPELRAALDAMYAAFHRSPSSHEEQERAMNQAWELLARTAAED